MHLAALLCCLLLQDAAPAAAPAGATTREPASLHPLFARVVVLGASASAGFGVREEIGKAISVAELFDRAILAPHAPVENFTSDLFFMNPRDSGEYFVDLAKGRMPTLVVALDFLFWFGYGIMRDGQRLKSLEKGLTLLESFECPVLIALLPDMRESVGKMLDEKQLPSPETLAALNARIVEWQGEQDNVHVIPLVEIHDRLRRKQPLEIHGHEIQENGSRRLLMPDRLHPSLLGTSCLVIACLDYCQKNLDPKSWPVAEADCQWNSIELTRCALDARPPAPISPATPVKNDRN